MASVVEDVRRRVTLRLVERGHDPREASAVGDLVASDLRNQWGGDRPYIEKGYHERIAERNARIRAEHAAGSSVSQLSAQHGLDRQTIYDIVFHRQRRRR